MIDDHALSKAVEIATFTVPALLFLVALIGARKNSPALEPIGFMCGFLGFTCGFGFLLDLPNGRHLAMLATLCASYLSVAALCYLFRPRPAPKAR